MKIWCFEDHQKWGHALYKAATARGWKAYMFSNPHMVTDGYVFVHMWHNPKTRARDKWIMETLALNPDIVLIPEYRSARLYDDKIEQTRELAKWMPRTFVCRTMAEASRAARVLGFPIISKTSEGAGSYNVRLIRNESEAISEIDLALHEGIRCKYGQVQKGYVLWQEFCKDNAGDIRVIAVGSTRMLLTRKNRAHVPFASGSGMIQPIKDRILPPELESALQFADEFFTRERFTWCGIDLVRHHETRAWKVLETTVGWTFKGYLDCLFYGDDKGRHGAQTWDVLLDEIQKGSFG